MTLEAKDTAIASLSPQWRIDRLPGDLVSLRTASNGKAILVSIIAAIAFIWNAVVYHRLLANPPPDRAIQIPIGIGVLLIAFTIWCAFGREFWLLSQNQIDHCVGIGSLSYRRRYRHAKLRLRSFQSSEFSVRVFVLEAVEERGSSRLFERNDRPEIEALGSLAAQATGWPIEVEA